MTPAEKVLSALTEALTAAARDVATVTVTHTVTATWRERLHTCPDDAVLYLAEAGEALGLSKDALRKRLDRGDLNLPYTMKFGRRTFRAADVRTVLRGADCAPGVLPLTRRRRPA